jgi:hypothetical protein
LDRFSEAHFIGQDNVPTVVPTFDQPVYAFQLVATQQASILRPELLLFEDRLVLGVVLKQFFSFRDVQIIELILVIVDGLSWSFGSFLWIGHQLKHLLVSVEVVDVIDSSLFVVRPIKRSE